MLTDALKKNGPCLSNELADYLVKAHGISPESARKRISRSEKGVKKLGHLPFPKKSRFIYLESQYASHIFWRNLFKAIYDLKGPYSRALHAINARTIVPIEHFRAASGAPIQQKKHINSDAVLSRLVDAGILVKTEISGLGWCVLTKQTFDENSGDLTITGKAVTTRLIVEGTLIQAVSDWLKRLGMVSYDSVRSRTLESFALPTVGTFAWDLTAPTYIPGLTTTKVGKRHPGFVVCDVLLSQQVTLESIEPFLHKVNTLQALKSIGRTMYIFVAGSYTKEAFDSLKQLGVVPATVENLFGTEISKALKSIISALERAADGVIDVDSFLHLFSTLGPLEGALGNIRGYLFEFLVADILRLNSAGNPTIEISKKIKTLKGEDAEIDIWVESKGRTLRLVECKGMASSVYVDDNEIDKWLNIRIPRVQTYLKEKGELVSGVTPIYELWTCGKISDKSLDDIYQIQERVRKYEVRVVNAETLLDEAKITGNKNLTELLYKVYLNPLGLLKTVKKRPNPG